MRDRSGPPVAVLGAGGHAKVVLGALRAAERPVVCVLDDDSRTWGRHILGVPVAGPIASLASHGTVAVVIAIGSNAARERVAQQLVDVTWATVIHPSAFVDPSVTVGPGTVVFAGAVLQPETRLGAHVIINTSASVDHDCVIEDFTHLAPGVHLAGDVQVGRGAFLGIGSAVIPGRRIGARATVGAGAAVIRDVPDGVTVVGVPARPRA